MNLGDEAQEKMEAVRKRAGKQLPRSCPAGQGRCSVCREKKRLLKKTFFCLATSLLANLLSLGLSCLQPKYSPAKLASAQEFGEGKMLSVCMWSIAGRTDQ